MLDIRRASASSAVRNASDIVVMVERHIMSLIGLQNPLLYLPTVIYSGSFTSTD